MTWTSLLVIAVLAASMLGACTSEPRLQVTAEIVESDAPASVRVETADDGRRARAHLLHVRWEGDADVLLRGARFLHYVSADGEQRLAVHSPDIGSTRSLAPNDPGALYIAGHDCAWVWDPAAEQPVDHCWDALVPVVMEHDATHAFFIRMFHPDARGPSETDPGTYIVEEMIDWWLGSDVNALDTTTDSDGTFTIRITYEAR